MGLFRTLTHLHVDVISKVLRISTESDSVELARKQLGELAENQDFKLDYAEIIDEASFDLANNEILQKNKIIFIKTPFSFLISGPTYSLSL